MEDKSQFAGFWKRLGAYLIDTILSAIANLIVNFTIGFGIGVVMAMNHTATDVIRMTAGIVGMIVGLFMHLLYWSLFESSRLQATPGKMALGIVVTDGSGKPISLARAIGRNAGKIISGLCLCLGFIIAGFTERRQAAHDLLANTLVVKKDAPLRIGAAQGFNVMH